MLPVPFQMKIRVGTTPNEELFDSLLWRKLLEWFVCVDDRQRHENAARPRGDLVDIEVKPVRKKNDLRWNRRNSVVLVLPQRAEINFSECVALNYAAVRKHPITRFHQYRGIRVPAHQLQ